MFSPAVLNGSTIRPLFVTYQLLQALRSVHNQGLFMGPIVLSNISVNENLWIQAVPFTWKALFCKTYKSYLENQEIIHKQSTEANQCKSSYAINQENASPTSQSYSLAVSNKLNLSSLVKGWVDGAISNYDYLIALNKVRVMYSFFLLYDTYI